VTTVARATDDNLTEITIDTKALDGYGMISETSEDSTSEAKELPGICKRNLGHQAVVQPETLKLKRYILKPNSSIVTTLHGQHWSTLVNDMHSAQRKSCKELQIGGCWSSSKAGADTSCISWRA
jgi:hypothetical protein